MKKYALSLSLLWLSFNGLAQNVKYFLDKDNQITDSANARSFMIVFEKLPNDTVYQMKQFSLENLMLISGSFEDAALSIPHGTYYYYEISRAQQNGPNNQKPITRYLDKSGSFFKGKMQGVWTSYFADGSVKQIQTFRNDELNGLYQIYGQNGKVMTEGNYQNGLREGKWIDRFGLHEVVYRNDKEVKRTVNKVLQKEMENESRERTKYDVKARPIGNFVSQLRDFMKQENHNNIVNENASVTFTVNENGEISNPTVSGMTDFVLMGKVKAFFLKLDKWHPGTTGKEKTPVKTLVTYTLFYQ